MSRSAKKMKLEPTTRTNGHLHSGQFMTSRIDDNEVKIHSYLFLIFFKNILANGCSMPITNTES
jgi:hypothetical protein